MCVLLRHSNTYMCAIFMSWTSNYLWKKILLQSNYYWKKIKHKRDRVYVIKQCIFPSFSKVIINCIFFIVIKLSFEFLLISMKNWKKKKQKQTDKENKVIIAFEAVDISSVI